MITLKEIAQQCEVSISTVSNILNGKPKVSLATKERVMRVVKETGYQPNFIAQGLRKQKTQTIGIIAEDISLFSTPVIIENIMAYCEEKGYKIIMENLRLYARWQEEWYHNDEEYNSVLEPAINELLSIKVDGIIYVAGHARIMHSFPPDFQIPAVMTYGYTKLDNIPSIAIDDEKGGYDMTKYLISMGHRKIGMIGGRADNIHTKMRLVGYQKALFEEQILFNPDYIKFGNWKRPTGYENAGSLVDIGVTAILCLSDLIAGGVYDYLEEHNLSAGEDISVAGFDNQVMAEYFRPALTTMDLPLIEIGRLAAETLIKIIEKAEGHTKHKVEAEYILPCTLIERKSVWKEKWLR